MAVDKIQVADIIKSVHDKIYGDDISPANVFNGGNVGMVAIAVAIDQASIRLSDSLNNLASALNKQKEVNELP